MALDVSKKIQDALAAKRHADELLKEIQNEEGKSEAISQIRDFIELYDIKPFDLFPNYVASKSGATGRTRDVSILLLKTKKVFYLGGPNQPDEIKKLSVEEKDKIKVSKEEFIEWIKKNPDCLTRLSDAKKKEFSL